MAGKFVDLNDAAKMVGVTPDNLIEMRSRSEIFGYRDGASWKFKLEEVERVISERGEQPRGDSAIHSGKDEDFDRLITGLSSKIMLDRAQEEEDANSALISEEALGMSSGGNPSTIIGKQGPASAGDSDLLLAPEGSGKSGSDNLLEAPGSKLQLGREGSDVLTGSDIQSPGSGTGEMPAIGMAPSDSGLSLGENLELGDDNDLAFESDMKVGSDKGGSSIGSDVTLNAGDSGINMAPSDSGLSLDEEPLELGGSSVDSLELPEDNEVVSLDDEAFDPDQATQLKADDQFLLSPSDNLLEDESDSGSQVIALEDSEAFDQDAATMLRSEGAALTDDAFVPAPSDALGAQGQQMAGAPVYVQVPMVETPYSIWNVLSLGSIAMLLALTGMLMVDIMLNMWMWDDGQARSMALMDLMLSTFGMNN